MSHPRKLSLLLVLAAMFALPGCAGADETTDSTKPEAKARPAAKAPAAPAKKAATAPAAAPAPAAPADEWVVLETSVGDVTIDLFEDQTPGHAENFKKLVRQGYYDGSPFHRVISGFMAQGGGKWGPGPGGIVDIGYTIPAELRPDTLPHQRGSVAAARTNNPEKASSGSQFYICYTPQPMLDQMGYTVFGKVVKGMENVDKITVGTGPNGMVTPQTAATVVKRAYLVPASTSAAASGQ